MWYQSQLSNNFLVNKEIIFKEYKFPPGEAYLISYSCIKSLKCFNTVVGKYFRLPNSKYIIYFSTFQGTIIKMTYKKADCFQK